MLDGWQQQGWQRRHTPWLCMQKDVGNGMRCFDKAGRFWGPREHSRPVHILHPNPAQGQPHRTCAELSSMRCCSRLSACFLVLMRAAWPFSVGASCGSSKADEVSLTGPVAPHTSVMFNVLCQVMVSFCAVLRPSPRGCAHLSSKHSPDGRPQHMDDSSADAGGGAGQEGHQL